MGLKKIEILEPIKDFYKTKKTNEKSTYIILPLFVGLLYVVFINLINAKPGISIDSFLRDYVNSQITVMALFISFSMAYLTILITSNSKNIEDIKSYVSEEYELNNRPLFLFQVLLIDITYTIIIEIVLLIFSFLQKFLILISGNLAMKIYILINIIIFTHILLLLFINVKNIYFTFWNSK